MRASVWDTIISNVGDREGGHVFGLALMNGYHSVTVVVERRPDPAETVLYFADQHTLDRDRYEQAGSAPGFRRYDKAGLEHFQFHRCGPRLHSSLFC